MPPSLTAALAAAVVAALWLLGRRRPPLIRDADTSAVAALNRAQIALVQEGGVDRAAWPSGAAPELLGDTESPESLRNKGGREGPGALALPQRRVPHEVLRFQRTLRMLYKQGGSARLEAIQAARLWGDPLTLPLLRRALRDPDPAVMREAAAAIHRFRGRPGTPAKGTPQPAALPRRVARTR
jgi:HEAT repeat protein